MKSQLKSYIKVKTINYELISDAILDECMRQDPMSRVACEATSCTGFVLVTGEISTKAHLDVPAIVRETVNEIGYNDAKNTIVFVVLSLRLSSFSFSTTAYIFISLSPIQIYK